MPSNWASESPVAKNVAAVPSGPTKLNGPAARLLAATWNWSVVLTGVVSLHARLLQCTVSPGLGLASLVDDVNVPDAANPLPI